MAGPHPFKDRTCKTTERPFDWQCVKCEQWNTFTQEEQDVSMRTVPVLDKDGNIQLYDIYVGDAWIGSRRTLEQCAEAFKNYRSSCINAKYCNCAR